MSRKLEKTQVQGVRLLQTGLPIPEQRAGANPRSHPDGKAKPVLLCWGAEVAEVDFHSGKISGYCVGSELEGTDLEMGDELVGRVLQ